MSASANEWLAMRLAAVHDLMGGGRPPATKTQAAHHWRTLSERRRDRWRLVAAYVGETLAKVAETRGEAA